MKWLKKFESAEDPGLKFSHIVEILDDLRDEPNFDVSIISGRGVSLPLNVGDVINLDVNKMFSFKRWEGSRDSFSIKVSFNSGLNYIETVEVLERFKSFVGRFDDLGFYLYKFWLNCDNDSDVYRFESIEYNFEAYEK